VVRRVEWSKREVAPAYRDRRGQMPNALRIGLLGPLRLQDTAGRVVPVGGRQLRVLFSLLALNAGRVGPATSMAEQIWPDDPPGKPGNALQTLVSRLRADRGSHVTAHPAGPLRPRPGPRPEAAAPTAGPRRDRPQCQSGPGAWPWLAAPPYRCCGRIGGRRRR